MPSPNLLLYLSPESVTDALPTYIVYVREALTLGVRCIYHYHALPKASKDIMPHLALSSFTLSDDAQSAPGELMRTGSVPQLPALAVNASQSRSGCTLDTKPEIKHSTAMVDTNLQSSSSVGTVEASPASVHLPRGSAEEAPLISWTDDDIDATDYKNMPDYDPDQEDSVYDSTPNPETESRKSPRTEHSFEDRSSIRRYVKLHAEENSSAEDISAAYLLLLFIPGPLNPPTAPPTSTSRPTAPSKKHWAFLAHLSRYPYLTSHNNYIRHTGYVLESADNNAHSQYLIVQEFSDLERQAGRKVSMDWELKRLEAKYWWRKEERGASRVKVGFFKLSHKEEILERATHG